MAWADWSPMVMQGSNPKNTADILVAFPYRAKAVKGDDGLYRAWIPAVPGVGAIEPNRKRALRKCMREALVVLESMPVKPAPDRAPPSTNEVPTNLPQKDIDRFWRSVDKSGGPDACWRWLQAEGKNGYGRINFRGLILLSHRVSFSLAGKTLRDGELVCHTCNNRMCCNPSHLYAGNKADNARDMMLAGTHNSVRRPETVPRGERHGSRTCPEAWGKGSKSRRAILNETDVVAIRQEYDSGNVTMESIAKRYGVATSAIFAVIHRTNWSHVA